MGRLCNGGAPFLLVLVSVSDCWTNEMNPERMVFKAD